MKLLTGNAVFAGVPGTSHLQAGNLVGSLAQIEEYLKDPLAPLGQLNLKPKSLMQTGAISCALSEPFPDIERDFDGLPYQHCGAGAYANTQGLPEWKPTLALKPKSALQHP